jgi:hypothetical protein
MRRSSIVLSSAALCFFLGPLSVSTQDAKDTAIVAYVLPRKQNRQIHFAVCPGLPKAPSVSFLGSPDR